MRLFLGWFATLICLTRLTAAEQPNRSVVRFEDVTAAARLIEPLEGIMGHGGAWGDVNGDNLPDLFVGGFCDRPNAEYAPASGPAPCRLLINEGHGKFRLAETSKTAVFGRTSGAVFADLDNSGLPELFIAHNARGSATKQRGEIQHSAMLRASQLFRNDGGTFIDITKTSGAVPESLLSARNIGALDFDGDGLLDLFVVEDQFVGKGRKPRSALMRNLGELRFADVTKETGLPEDIHGLGLAVADLNNDSRPDIFVGHSNRLFLSQPGNKYREAMELSDLFRWKPLDGEDWPCGVAFGDLNRDRRLDLVIGIHHVQARNRVYLNEGVKDGVPQFRDITEAAGLADVVPAKCPHVEIQDFDNDGWPDIFFSAGWQDGDDFTPLIYRHVGLKDGVPKFVPPRPIAAPMVYFPAAPTADFDRDGRLDLFCINWFSGNRSRLLRNIGGGKNHWLRVAARGSTSNRDGIGSRVRVYRAGQFGDESALLGCQEISVGFGYASGQEPIAHFGLGKDGRVDVEVMFPSGRSVNVKNAWANRPVMVDEPPTRSPDAHVRTEKSPDVSVRATAAKATADKAAAKATETKKAEAKKPEPKKAAAKPKAKPNPEPMLDYPPQLPGGVEMATDSSPDFLKPTGELADGVVIAKTPPTIDFAYFPGQTYPGRPWSNWGDSSFAKGKYFTAIGDHLAPQGNAFIFEYDPATKRFRQLLDLCKLLALPDGHYTPGKIHSRVDLGSDGWLYASTHRGSTNATTDANHYLGDWIVRCHPETAASEIVSRGPLGKRCIPNGRLDPERLIFYGGTAPGNTGDNAEVMLFAFDTRGRKLLYSGEDGPQRYMILTKSGRVYYTPFLSLGPLMRFDPDSGKPPEKIPGEIGIRAATRETPDGFVYTVSQPREGASKLYRFNTKDESVEELGPAAVGVNHYVAAMSSDPTGRYVYYVPGAHGGSEKDGSAVIQFDTQLRRRKVIAFLHPFYQTKYGAIPKGTYGLAIGDDGATLFITWNVSRGSRAWDCCALSAIHIPASERPTE